MSQCEPTPWNEGPPTAPGLYWYVLTAGRGGKPVTATYRMARVFAYGGVLCAPTYSGPKPCREFARLWAGPLREPAPVPGIAEPTEHLD